jgi:hypothetical protein
MKRTIRFKNTHICMRFLNPLKEHLRIGVYYIRFYKTLHIGLLLVEICISRKGGAMWV